MSVILLKTSVKMQTVTD